MSHDHGAQHLTHNHDGDGDAALVELLDLDGEVLATYWADVLASVQAAAAGIATEHILDLGAGSGVGSIALAQHFADAEVIAVDVSAAMLARIHTKARDLGLADRIRTVESDLDAGWPPTGPVDITWASMSMHHLTDPDRVLGEVLAATRPGGLMAVIELAESVRMLPDDLGFGRPGLEARCLEVLDAEHAVALPALGSNWAARLTTAGFTVLSEQTTAIDRPPPPPPATARYAQLWLGRVRTNLADRLEPDDRDALDRLIDGDGPESLLRRDDLHVRASRTLTLARRP